MGVALLHVGVSTIDMYMSCRALEGTFRSVNNLLETLHHSEFFYFNSAMWRFISIGQYMPALIFLVAPLVVEVSYVCIIYTKTYRKEWLRSFDDLPCDCSSGSVFLDGCARRCHSGFRLEILT